MTDPNMKTATGDLRRRVLTSQRARQRAMSGKVITENAMGNLNSNHDYRCLQLMGYDMNMILEKKGLLKRIKAERDAIASAIVEESKKVEAKDGEQKQD